MDLLFKKKFYLGNKIFFYDGACFWQDVVCANFNSDTDFCLHADYGLTLAITEKKFRVHITIQIYNDWNVLFSMLDAP